MFRRLFLVFLPSFTASICHANQASWNCEQNKDTKAWVCVGENKAKAAAAPAPAPAITETTTPAAVAPRQAMPLAQPTANAPQTLDANPAGPAPSLTTSPTPAVVAPRQAMPLAQPNTNAAQPITAKASPPSDQPRMPQPHTMMPLATEERTTPQSPSQPQPATPKPSAEARSTSPNAWNCGINKATNSWDCQQGSGGNPQTVAANGTGDITPVKAAPAVFEDSMWRMLDPAFDRYQEQTFNELAAKLTVDPWEKCSIDPVVEGAPLAPAETIQRDGSPLDVKSNYAEVFDNEVGSYSGNVKMSRADQQASSNTANYDSVSEVLDLHGNVYYRENELALASQTATLELASDQAKLRDVQFITPTPLRGRAKTVYRDNKTLSRYQDVAYTSCKPGNQDWIVHASELKLNKTAGRGSAKNTWIEFKGTPVFYSPYLSFPIDNRRLSGFLAPVFGSTQNSGFNLSAPYYWNIAPNYDATLNPRYLTKRGVVLAGKFRYLTEMTKGTTSVEFMPDDNITNKPRYQGSVKNKTDFTDKIKSNVDINYVSDKKYFAELGNALSFPNYSYLRSDADIRYQEKGISFVTRAENYQAINATIPDRSLPYRRLPQINLDLNHSFKFMPLRTGIENEFVYFQHNSLVTSQRFNTKPSFSIPLQTTSAYLTPKVSFQYSQYFLNSGDPGTPDSTARTLPFLSTDSGLFFEKDVKIADHGFLHTLEPRLFYLYVPYTNQRSIPLFDTAQYDFSYNSMFRENSFSGADRIQNANQVTAALTTRLIDPKSGRESLKLSVGEIFYFQDRNVTLPIQFLDSRETNGIRVLESAVETNRFSPLVAELSSEMTDHISATSSLQWDPHVNEVVRGQATLHYVREPDEIFNVGYVYRKNHFIENTLNSNNIPFNDPLRSNVRSDDIIQSDVSFRWPIYDNWYALGRWQYSLLYNTTQEGFFGVEKENCCWRFRIIGRHYINNINNINNTINNNRAVEGTSQNGIFFQVELKGLTGIGEKLDTFFEKNLYGYRKLQND